MLLKKIKFCSLILIFLLPNEVLIADNYKNTKFIEDIKIEFDQSKNRDFVTNLFRAYVDLNNQNSSKTIFQTIKKKYSNKWFQGYVHYKNKKYKAEIRIFGELKDHIQIPISSVKVKLKEGHISNITRFILFLPKTRNEEKEVFWSLLNNKLGIKAFYTQMVDVNFMNKNYKSIFQEDVSKEFLERNKLKETIVIKENDYNHFNLKNKKGVYPNFYSLVVNNGSFLKNKVSLEIASNAISTFITNKEDNLFRNNQYVRMVNNKYAWHGMLSHNRKFIYSPLDNSFEEIYYDGSVNYKAFRNNECKFKPNEEFHKFEKKYSTLSNKKLSTIEKCIYAEKMGIYNFYKKNNKLPYEDKFFFESDFELMKQNLNNVRKTILNNFLIEKTNLNKDKKFLTFSFYHEDKYYLVDYYLISKKVRNFRNINFDTYKDSLRGRLYFDYLEEKIPVFNLGNLLDKEKIKLIADDDLKKKKIIIYDPGTYNINLIKNNTYNLDIYFDSSHTKLIINGSINSEDKFRFIDTYHNSNLDNNINRYDQNLLNGCINFLQVSFEGGSLYSEGMKCEDSINIVKSNGKIDNIVIKKSNFDGLDIDISDLKISNLKIIDSKNDCLDLSYGNYEIRNIYLQGCSDKAISVGEKSKLISKKIVAKKSNYALVSKDSSKVFVDNLFSLNNTNCLGAYKKKQEFDGGFINISSMECSEHKNISEIDPFSKIILNNKELNFTQNN